MYVRNIKEAMSLLLLINFQSLIVIDWQLELTFDNFLRISIYRLSYSTLFMSATVCSSACRRYEPLIVTVIVWWTKDVINREANQSR